MEYLAEADELVLEYLMFRGFMATFKCFQVEQVEDKLQSLSSERVATQLLSYVEGFELFKLLDLWTFLERRCLEGLDAALTETAVRLKNGLLRLYLVHAKLSGKQAKLAEFFEHRVIDKHCVDTPNKSEWRAWYALPYCPEPAADVHFAPFFGEEWSQLLADSLHNFLAQVFRLQEAPRLLCLPLQDKKQQALEGQLRAKEYDCIRLQDTIERLKYMLANAQVASSLAVAHGDESPVEASALGGGIPEERIPDKHAEGLARDIDSDSSGVKKNGSQTGAVSDPDDAFAKTKSLWAVGSHTSAAHVARFSSDGRLLATASDDATMCLWSFATGKRKLEQEQKVFSTSGVCSLAWHNENPGLMAFGNASSTVVLWDSGKRTQLAEIVVSADLHLPMVTDVDFCPRKQLLLSINIGQSSTSSSGGGVLSSGLLRPVSGHARASGPEKRGPFGLLSDFGQTATTFRDPVQKRSMVRLWNSSTLQLCNSLEPEGFQITTATFNHNGSLLVTGADDAKVRVYDVLKGTCIMEWSIAGAGPGVGAATADSLCTSIDKVVLSSDETAVLVLDAAGTVSMWSLHRIDKALNRFPTTSMISKAAQRRRPGSLEAVPGLCGDLVCNPSNAKQFLGCSPAYEACCWMFDTAIPKSRKIALPHLAAPAEAKVTSLDWALTGIGAATDAGEVDLFNPTLLM